MRVGVDVDGCLASFNEGFIALIHKMFGIIDIPKPGPNYPDTWSYQKPFLNREQENELWEVIKNSHFWGDLYPLEGCEIALNSLKILQLLGSHIYFITSRPGLHARSLTIGWLDLYGFEDPTVIIADKKGPVALRLGLDVFIDDKPENCIDVKLAVPNCRVFLVDQPYNRNMLINVERTASVSAALITAFRTEELRNAA